MAPANRALNEPPAEKATQPPVKRQSQPGEDEKTATEQAESQKEVSGTHAWLHSIQTAG